MFCNADDRFPGLQAAKCGVLIGHWWCVCTEIVFDCCVKVNTSSMTAHASAPVAALKSTASISLHIDLWLSVGPT